MASQPTNIRHKIPPKLLQNFPIQSPYNTFTDINYYTLKKTTYGKPTPGQCPKRPTKTD